MESLSLPEIAEITTQRSAPVP